MLKIPVSLCERFSLIEEDYFLVEKNTFIFLFNIYSVENNVSTYIVL